MVSNTGENEGHQRSSDKAGCEKPHQLLKETSGQRTSQPQDTYLRELSGRKQPRSSRLVLVNLQCHLRISWRAFKSTDNWAPTPSAFLTGLEAMVMLLASGPSVCCDHLCYLGYVLELPWNPSVCLQSGSHRHLFPLLVLLCFVLNTSQMVLMPTEVEIPTASPLTLT